MAKPRNRAAQDTTLINLRALQRRVTALERQQRDVRRALHALGHKRGHA